MAHEMNAADYEALLKYPGNDKCIDCGAKHPEWGSISFGILFCTTCSGGHRGLGTHISRVRSIKMDSWTDVQVARMKVGGNQQCRDFLTKHGLDDFDKKTIRQRYDSKPAELYKTVLDARLAGVPEPTQLPLQENGGGGMANGNGTAPPKVNRKMEGFGSSPPPAPPNHHDGLKLGAYVVASAFVAWYILKDKDKK